MDAFNQARINSAFQAKSSAGAASTSTSGFFAASSTTASSSNTNVQAQQTSQYQCQLPLLASLNSLLSTPSTQSVSSPSSQYFSSPEKTEPSASSSSSTSQPPQHPLLSQRFASFQSFSNFYSPDNNTTNIGDNKLSSNITNQPCISPPPFLYQPSFPNQSGQYHQYRSFPPRKLSKQQSFPNNQNSNQQALSYHQQQQQQQAAYQYATTSSQIRGGYHGSGSGSGGGGRHQVPNPCKLFVGNIPRTATLEDIITVFQRFGPVDETHCAIKDNNYAFIHFYRREDAEHAQRELNNSLFMNRYIRVMFSNSTRTKGGGGGGGGRNSGNQRGATERHSPSSSLSAAAAAATSMSASNNSPSQFYLPRSQSCNPQLNSSTMSLLANFYQLKMSPSASSSCFNSGPK